MQIQCKRFQSNILYSLIQCFQALISDIIAGKNDITKLSKFVTTSFELCSFNPYTQQDSQEYLNCLLNGLHRDLSFLEIPNRNRINDLFQGFIKNTIKCKECNHLIEPCQEFYQLELSIPTEKINQTDYDIPDEEIQLINLIHSTMMHQIKDLLFKSSIYTIFDCLHLFFKPQHENKYCEICLKETEHEFKEKIEKLPKCLILNFKRFKLS